MLLHDELEEYLQLPTPLNDISQQDEPSFKEFHWGAFEEVEREENLRKEKQWEN